MHMLQAGMRAQLSIVIAGLLCFASIFLYPRRYYTELNTTTRASL